MCSACPPPKVRRRVCARPSGRHPLLCASARQTAARCCWAATPHPLRRLRHHGLWRGRPGAGEAAAEPDLRHRLPPRDRRLSDRQAPPRRGPPGRGAGSDPHRVRPRSGQNAVLEFFGPGVKKSGHGLPLRHRRHDHRDRLPELRLVHRRHHQSLSGGAGPRDEYRAMARRRRLL